MKMTKKPFGQPAVASILLGLALAQPLAAQSLSEEAERQAKIDELLVELAQPDLKTWEAVEQRLIRLWEQSGSPTADLLLKRGEEAIQAEDYATAIEHLTALTDHAPNFAEGWHLRATAFYLAQEHGLAIADLRRALSLNPQHFSALTGLGIILEDSGDYEGALKAMELAKEINPHRDTVTDAIERLNHRLGRSTL